jgi:hypothetical protein
MIRRRTCSTNASELRAIVASLVVLAPVALAALSACDVVTGTEDVDVGAGSRADGRGDAGPAPGAPAASSADDDETAGSPSEPPSTPSSPSPPPPGSPSPSPDAGAGGPTILDAGPPDEGPDCDAFADLRGAFLRAVFFPSHATKKPAYSPACVAIRAGQSVTFLGDFETYPLVPFGDGAKNPIPVVTKGSSEAVSFPAKGRFRYGSPSFPTMRGAVEVR